MDALRLGLCLLIFLFSLAAKGQNDRLRDANQIGWFVYNGDHALAKRWELHTEYQGRRTDFIRHWQQSLARVGLTHQIAPKLKLSGGYTSLVTYPYGEYPTADQGVPYPERRLYEDVQLSDTLGKIGLGHRFRLEQRWIAELTNRRVTDWEFQNRARYQFSATVPLCGLTLDDREWYLTFFDELFIGFGRNVGRNVFNQHRISGGIGYQFREHFKLELAYLNQITQHAEPAPQTGKDVFEYNYGFRMGIVYDVRLTR